MLAFGSHGENGPSAQHLVGLVPVGGCALAVTHPVEAATLVLVNLSRLNFARSWIAKVRGFHFKVPIDQLKPEILKLQLWNRILKRLIKVGCPTFDFFILTDFSTGRKPLLLWSF